MNYKMIRSIAVSIFLMLPSMTHSMFLALAKRTYFSHDATKRTFFYPSVLRNKIDTPRFKLVTTQEIISNLDDHPCEARNGLIEHIVFKATEYKKNERKYAAVLGQLREHGWSKRSCCKAVMLHSAVISDLPCVTKELLLHDPNWVHETDLHGCVPIDYAQSRRIIKMLKDARSRDAQPYTGEDIWYRVPGYGWQDANPLRKAAYNGNVKIMNQYIARAYMNRCDDDEDISKDEAKILLAIADLRFWRTNDQKYLEIRKTVIEFYECF